MTIQELREKKAQLEFDIQRLVISFQTETEINIKSIQVVQIENPSKCGMTFITGIDSTVDL